MIIPSNRIKDYWTIILLIAIIYVASYWLVHDLKKGKRMFPDKLYLHLSLALMNKYEPKNKRLIKFKNGDITIIRVVEIEKSIVLPLVNALIVAKCGDSII